MTLAKTLNQQHAVAELPMAGISSEIVWAKDIGTSCLIRGGLSGSAAVARRAYPCSGSGTAGTGKTSIAAAFVDGMCRAGRKCMYFSFEESPEQIVRNMRSIGIDVTKWLKSGLLQLQAIRPTLYGLEMHLAQAHKLVEKFGPEGIVIDPVTNLTSVGETSDVKAMLTRLIDFLKNAGITTIFTSLTSGGEVLLEQTEIGVSSLMDTWLLVRMLESNGERNRILYVLKSRGMAHSNQMREFVLSEKGINLVDVYVGPGTVLTGSARLHQEAKDRAEVDSQQQASQLRERGLEQRAAALRAQAHAIAAELENIQSELQQSRQIDDQRRETLARQRRDIAVVRKADRKEE